MFHIYNIYIIKSMVQNVDPRSNFPKNFDSIIAHLVFEES